jgi:hypothetical protein
MRPALQALEREYRLLRKQLARVGYLSRGSVVARRPGRPGSRYQWTTKVKARTVSLTLSAEQYEWLKAAVGNQRKVETIFGEMHRLSRQIMRLKFPDAPRRKKLNQKVLRLI